VDVLILGGTAFLGRHVVEAASTRHRVTIFHRGTTTCPLPRGVEEIVGDRTTDLERLAGRRWGAAIDTSGFDPDVVRRSASALAGRVERYVFSSTISVYADLSVPGLTEDAELNLTVPENDEAARYGPLKALSELVVQHELRERATIVRPGLLVGRWDPTDRFTYWPQRLLRGGEVLAPGRPGRPVQFIDAGDLAKWIVHLIETDAAGVFHATGPAAPLTMGELLQRGAAALRAGAKEPATFVWIPEPDLLAAHVQPWMDLPLWLPESGEVEGMLRVDNGRAVSAGLTFRSVEETFIDVGDWLATLPEQRERKAGLSPARERELLERWHSERTRSQA